MPRLDDASEVELGAVDAVEGADVADVAVVVELGAAGGPFNVDGGIKVLYSNEVSLTPPVTQQLM